MKFIDKHLRSLYYLDSMDFKQLTVAIPWTWAVVPSGSVIIWLLGSTCIIETVPSAFWMECNIACVYWIENKKKIIFEFDYDWNEK